MKILYVTSVWTPLYPILYNRESEVKGMPAFVYVLKKLIEEGNEIDIIFYDNCMDNERNRYSISSDWFKKVNILKHVYIKDNKSVRKIISTSLGYIKIANAVKRALNSKKYDFIYGHGPLSEAASHYAKKYKIPFGQRRYGDTYWDLIEKKGCLYAFLSQPWNYYSYKNKKAFMLATNDGSRVDKTYELINKGKKPYPFYMWLNGVPQQPSDITLEIDKAKFQKPYLFYAARIASWKRQHLALEILNILKKRNLEINLFIAGQNDDDQYFNYLSKKIDEYNIKDQVFFIGSVNVQELQYLAKESLASLSLYDPCNLGNVFIEYFSAGSLVISCNDGSLDGIVKNNENGFLVDDMEQAANIIESLLNDEKQWMNIRVKAKETSERMFLSWEKRVSNEIELIKSAINSVRME
ncbi:glycosyltransferase family 4 protein [Bacillus sp. JJ1532]|uniref:glycosyltransferase family 4 protein n=1 Tax=Bacillus sp. JJ1532 TaxID=3122958 RepID=UPI002FFF77A2